MLTPVPPTDCMRAREAVSARLDGELGELDAARVEQHLDRCAACASFAGELGSVARTLRGAALVPAPAELFTPRRGRRLPAPFAAAAATLVVAAAIGSSFFAGELVGGSSTSHPGVARTARAVTDPGLVAMLREAAPRRARTGRVVAL